jgi:hypothetical protein
VQKRIEEVAYKDAETVFEIEMKMSKKFRINWESAPSRRKCDVSWGVFSREEKPVVVNSL